MISLRIISVKDIPLTLVVGILRKQLERGELSDLQRRVFEYGETVIKCSPERAEKAFEELLRLGLKEVTASQIIDIYPRSIDEIKILLAFEEKRPSEEVLNKILDILRENCEVSTE